MAKSNMNFKATLSLVTKDFKKGVKVVQTSLNSLRMRFMSFAGAVAGGIGLADFARQLKDVASNMNKAQTVLRNVSADFNEYAGNQEYLIGLSRKYAQEVVGLTNNFAKFHSAASNSGMALEDQKKIFESMTRASSYFNLSADETNSVMLALTQMMSKGKVQAEELRQQLGERLPGAMTVMAKAMGTDGAGLEEMMRKGLSATDALPKFAAEFNKITKGINTDTIQGWKNQFSNALGELAKKLNVEGFSKKVIRTGTKTVNWITDNLDKVGSSILALGGAIAGAKINNVFKTWAEETNRWRAEVTKGKEDIKVLSDKAYEIGQKGKAWILPKGAMSEDQFDGAKPLGNDMYMLHEGDLKLKQIEQMKTYYKEIEAIEGRILKLEQRINNEGTKLQRIWSNVRKIASTIWTTLKGAFSSIVTGAITGAITWAISQLVQHFKELAKINQYVERMNKKAAERNKEIPAEDSGLQALMNNYITITEEIEKARSKGENLKKLEEERDSTLKKINEELGREEGNLLDVKKTAEEIRGIVEDELKLRQMMREVETAKETRANAETERKKALEVIKEARKGKKEAEEELARIPKNAADAEAARNAARKAGWFSGKRKKSEIFVHKADQLIAQQDTTIRGLENRILEKQKGQDEELNALKKQAEEKKEQQKKAEELAKKNEEIQKEYASIQSGYNKSINTLKDKLEKGLISQEEYDNALQALASSTLDSLYAMEGLNGSETRLGELLIERVRAYKQSNEPSLLKRIGEAEKGYNEALTELVRQLNAGAISPEEYEESFNDLVRETYATLASMGALEDSVGEFAEAMRQAVKDLKDRKNDKAREDLYKAFEEGDFGKKDRDSFFDYKKSESERLQEEADTYGDQAERLRQGIEDMKDIDSDATAGLLEYMNKLLDEAISKSEELGQAAKFAEMKEDVQALQEEVTSGLLDGINGVAGAFDRLRAGMQALSDPDTSGFEKVLYYLNMIIQSMETWMQLSETFKSVQKAVEQLSKAEQAASQATITGALASTAANQAETMSGAASSAAKLPFPANLAAIAASIAAIAGIFASLPHFSKGGVVPGNSTSGDKVLARLNSGEMVLTKGQQEALLKRNGNGGQVQFKVRGSDLIGVLDNYRRQNNIR